MKTRKLRALTIPELLMVIAIITTLVLIFFPLRFVDNRKAPLGNTLQKAKQISLMLQMYAGDNDGAYPAYRDPDASSPILIKNSNEALEVLMPRYNTSKEVYENKKSAWCIGKRQPGTVDNQYKVGRYENDWSYVLGLTKTNDPRWPLLATAFAPGNGTNPEYVSDPKQRGGVWEGTNAIMIRVDCSASIEETKLSGTNYMIKRVDSPMKNAFTPDEDWLGGSTIKGVSIQVLNPLE